MTQESSKKITVPATVAKYIVKDAPRESRLLAARGEAGLAGRDLCLVLFYLCHGTDVEIRNAGVLTLRKEPSASLAMVAAMEDLPEKMLHFLAQVRGNDPAVLAALLGNRALAAETIAFLLERTPRGLLPLLFACKERWQSVPESVTALLRNPQLTPEERATYEPQLPPEVAEAEAAFAAGDEDEVDTEAESAEELPAEEDDVPVDEENFSKYQLALEMGVSEKIKMALTGDKEWRSIFFKDANKLVNTAVLKNPRITDGEVLAVAKSKTTSEELIRIILLNKEWMKNPAIKTALVTHPKTPIPSALRFMSILSEKDLKTLAKSKGVSQIIVNNARRMVSEKAKKK